ncbi:Fusaric acid resistance protein-like-domain-containing protein [Annulohypoxylon maeteangense]|uniref:Fusaric acid resistance protein-like-domain-containing protein n=1 Tax=Annulohypoxylon maeteangense TaxID=1927788 RepID=UPI002008B414|nr:Fusaric acid resistance protein-like-domain-containing protein [Annulohypoxylon maeteangense]KAI0885686.1 Fusaric acid resistance protein-like-domain-containing protein [Annulohypoxylon maeteangense]
MTNDNVTSSTVGGGTSRWLPRPARAPTRTKLRNGTWVVPGTGERTRRQFTLRYPHLDGPSDDDNLRPLAEGTTIKDKVRNVWHNTRVSASKLWAWSNSPKGRGTIKCSIAYLLASMGTFWHPAAAFLGPMDGKHIVATISVYFHPARSAGSQIEAVAIAVVAVCYAMFIGTLSMATSVLFGSVLDMVELSYALVLMIFIGGGLGFVGWVKQKLNNPLVSVGASIASIGIITIVTKENSVHTGVFTNQKIIQSLKILLMATTVSTLVNLLIWPVSARLALRKSMQNASTSLGAMLSMIASGFLSGAEEDFTSSEFTKASSTYTSTLTQMNKNARESKYEYFFLGQEQIYRQDRAVVKSMENLAQSLGGLRSAANTQFELLREVSNGYFTSSPAVSPTTNPFSPTFTRSLSAMLKSGSNRVGSLGAIDEAPDERSDREDEPTPTQEMPFAMLSPSGSSLKTPSDIFELFIARLGPSMKSLVYTMAEMLKEPPFGVPGSPITINEQFKQSLSDATSLYNQARGNALEEIYKTIELGRTRSESVQADFEEVAAACGHFSFSLLSFADEMQIYLDTLDDLRDVVEQNNRSWKWIMFWKHFKFPSKAKNDDVERLSLLKPVKRLRQSKMPKGIPDAMKNRRGTFSWDTAPQGEGIWDHVVRATSRSLLKFFGFLARDDIRFGLKVGIGATLYAMFAFIPQTRPVYAHWRGEWGLLSFMIVCSMTVGAANATGMARFTGTIMGAAFVLVNWWISNGNAVALAFLGWAVSFGAFYIMVDRGNAAFGRFILLSYNVSSLYAYSLTQQVDDDDDDEGGVHPIIGSIAYHRVVAVSVGIVWGLIICRLIWPMPARQKFKEGLAVLYLQMGLVWKRGPLAVLLRNDIAAASYMKIGEQAAMQRYATQLQALRVSANNEYELRGPFPFQEYGRVMASTQRALDAFHAMSLVTQKHGRLSAGEKALLYYTAEERAQLCARICHVFQVLASSVMLEYPLTDAIPSVMVIRDKLLGKIFRFRKEHSHNHHAEGVENGGKAPANGHADTDADANAEADNGKAKAPKLGDVVVEEPDYALLYAYALVTGQLAKELTVVEEEIENLFGRLDEDALLLQ